MKMVVNLFVIAFLASLVGCTEGGILGINNGKIIVVMSNESEFPVVVNQLNSVLYDYLAPGEIRRIERRGVDGEPFVLTATAVNQATNCDYRSDRFEKRFDEGDVDAYDWEIEVRRRCDD
jgi:hypothetical protein